MSGMSRRPGTPDRRVLASRWLSPVRIKVWSRPRTASLVTETLSKTVDLSVLRASRSSRARMLLRPALTVT